MIRRAQPWLGTLVEVAIWDAPTEVAPDWSAAIQAAFQVIAQIHTCMSYHSDGSDIYAFNRAKTGTCLQLHPHTAAVLQTALQLQQQTGGIFDLRVASRLARLGLLPSQTRVPQYVPDQQAFRFVDDLCIEKLRDDWLDVGGIAKGYAVDQATKVLKNFAVQRACINAGGDLGVIGEHTISIRDPQFPTHMAMSLTLNQQCIASSASYFSERNRNTDLVETGAASVLIDGRNGDQISGGKSYSVIADQCMIADALTKLIAATGNPADACLDLWGARAIILPS
ncbi:FAD:protein FMN transferase [Undibacterium rugosum]|uniref:FAD:protein FMN transferase n=1 Tax=Undibacterium rugosum TaxID=2762291 RepID=UPI001B8464E2|nr:FAD:protein FMN transferase [Undibacterium rugosum]MBR7780194.1 FAD:protein FMN transferase [Undibacterium rugosum]